MHGLVNVNYEAVLRLAIASQGQTHHIDAAINTGYRGFLSLPPHIVNHLALPYLGETQDIFSHDAQFSAPTYQAKILWDSRYREVPVHQINTSPFVGISLLKGYNLQLQIIENGIVFLNTIGNSHNPID